MDELTKCHEEVRALTEENQQLREAASAFGSLAERLNGELRQERRTRETDRRHAPRPTEDRRRV
jgi:hypothetical protein